MIFKNRRKSRVLNAEISESKNWKEYPELGIKLYHAECNGECTVNWKWERPRDGRKFRKTLAKTFLFTEEEYEKLVDGTPFPKCPECGGNLQFQSWKIFQILMEIYDEAQEQLEEKLGEADKK